MTIDEQIKILEDNAEYIRKEGDLQGCLNFRQLAEWLKDYKRLLEQEPKTGHWIEIAQYSDGKHKIECSECKSHIFDRGHANSFNVKNRYKYCPNCGAKMAESEE